MLLGYEELAGNRAEAVRRLAAYLEVPCSQEVLERVLARSDKEFMRREAEQEGCAAHFTPEAEREALRRHLRPWHGAMIEGLVRGAFGAWEEADDAARWARWLSPPSWFRQVEEG